MVFGKIAPSVKQTRHWNKGAMSYESKDPIRNCCYLTFLRIIFTRRLKIIDIYVGYNAIV